MDEGKFSLTAYGIFCVLKNEEKLVQALRYPKIINSEYLLATHHHWKIRYHTFQVPELAYIYQREKKNRLRQLTLLTWGPGCECR
jgi:hypothetical protein